METGAFAVMIGDAKSLWEISIAQIGKSFIDVGIRSEEPFSGMMRRAIMPFRECAGLVLTRIHHYRKRAEYESVMQNRTF